MNVYTINMTEEQMTTLINAICNEDSENKIAFRNGENSPLTLTITEVEID